jgi:hypothetical protein
MLLRKLPKLGRLPETQRPFQKTGQGY